MNTDESDEAKSAAYRGLGFRGLRVEGVGGLSISGFKGLRVEGLKGLRV